MKYTKEHVENFVNELQMLFKKYNIEQYIDGSDWGSGSFEFLKDENEHTLTCELKDFATNNIKLNCWILKNVENRHEIIERFEVINKT